MSVCEHEIARWRGGVLGSLCLALVSCSGPPPSPPMSAVQRLNAEAVRRIDRGDINAAELTLRDALREAELVDDLAGQAETWNNLGALATARSRNDEAFACYTIALRLHRSRGAHDASEVRARTNLGSVLLAQGRPREAREQFEAAYNLATDLKQPSIGFLARVGLAAVTLREGNYADAIAKASSLANEARQARDDEATAAALQLEGNARLAQGDHVTARERLEQALSLDRKREAPGSVVSDLRSLARAAETSGDRAQASSYFARASRSARRLGDLAGAESDLRRAIEHARAASSPDVSALELELDALKQRPRE